MSRTGVLGHAGKLFGTGACRQGGGDTTSAILFELELKGLTNIGNKVENLLTEGVFGYDRNAYGY